MMELGLLYFAGGSLGWLAGWLAGLSRVRSLALQTPYAQLQLALTAAIAAVVDWIAGELAGWLAG